MSILRQVTRLTNWESPHAVTHSSQPHFFLISVSISLPSAVCFLYIPLYNNGSEIKWTSATLSRRCCASWRRIGSYVDWYHWVRSTHSHSCYKTWLTSSISSNQESFISSRTTESTDPTLTRPRPPIRINVRTEVKRIPLTWEEVSAVLSSGTCSRCWAGSEKEKKFSEAVVSVWPTRYPIPRVVESLFRV